VPPQNHADPRPPQPATTDDAPRLGYLLKQAQLRFGEHVRAALAPLGIDTREWAALICLNDRRPLSQAELGERSGIDRTTLVAVLDQLEGTGLVQRRPDRDDRRRNVVEITAAGRNLRTRAADEVDQCERQFLAALSEPEARQLKNALHTLIAPGQ
jgi:DNA-binding MarR family transcriptional regulator